MVKGEHLRPLLGFVVVCGFAALILATGVTSPSALRRIVAEQRVLPSPSLTELVLGRTFDPVPQRAAEPTPASPGVAAERRTSLVLSSLGQAGAATQVAHVVPQPAHHVPHPHKLPTKTTHGTTGTTEQAAAPASTHQTTAPQPVTQPVTQPSAQPSAQPTTQPVAKPTTPTKNAAATGGSHHDVQATADDTRGDSGSWHGRHHSHSRGHSHSDERHPRGDQHTSHGSHDSSQTHAVAASVTPSPVSGDLQHGQGGPGQGGHGHGDHGHGDHHGSAPGGGHSQGDHSHGHHH